jgi:hypothetical protein
MLNSLQLFAESAGALALRVAASQLALETAVVKLSVASASRVTDLASALQKVHFLQVNASVVDSLYREISAATRSLELLFNQTVQLDQQMNLLLEGRSREHDDNADGGASALAASLAPRTLMWTQYDSVRNLYANDVASESQTNVVRAHSAVARQQRLCLGAPVVGARRAARVSRHCVV